MEIRRLHSLSELSSSEVRDGGGFELHSDLLRHGVLVSANGSETFQKRGVELMIN